jgi:23S rRNA (cytosine1962-C5)-methyltransferase
MNVLRLKTHEDRRIRAGHLWAYSNEVDVAQTPLKNYPAGALVRVEDSRGKPMGLGTVNPHALLTVRMLSSNANAKIDVDWFIRRVHQALALRDCLYPSPHYRLIFGESDGLPGVVVDRFGEVLVVQITTAGMEALKDLLTAALQEVLKPTGILFRNDTAMRETEGLSADNSIIGSVPDEIEVLEAGVKFIAPLASGQKTGWFYDQVSNRNRLAPYATGGRVLDVFSYAGGWAVRALAAGAAEATVIDSSSAAIELAQRNAGLNGYALEAHKGDALEVMKALRQQGRTFDLVVVDPPALIKRKKDEEAGQAHYGALNRAAMQLLAQDGFLISCSCSHHLSAESLQRILLREARASARKLQMLEQGAQGPDHPVHPAIPETRYLKAWYCRATAG